jgi:GNAT superfamily N-acetyltransferase
MLIRNLHPITDRAAVIACQTAAQDYWCLAEGKCDPAAKAAEFFTDCPPGCDPTQSHHLGLFVDGELAGLAELSFGFPNLNDTYLGLMLLAPNFRNQHLGPRFLIAIETRARSAQAPALYLAVLESNLKGRAFWHRMGFVETGLSKVYPETGHCLHRLVKRLN